MALVETFDAVAEAGLAARVRSFWRGDPLRRRLLAVADLLAAAVFLYTFGEVFQQLAMHTLTRLAASLPLWLVFAKVAGLYDHDHRTIRHLTADELPSLLLWVLASGGVSGLLALGYDGSVFSAAMARALIATALTAVTLRAAARATWRHLVPRERVVVLGDGVPLEAVRRKFELFRDMHGDVVLELPHERGAQLIRNGSDFAVGPVDRLVVVASPSEPLVWDLISYCRRRGMKLSRVPAAGGQVASVARITQLGELSALEYNTWDVSRSTLFLKRALDVGAAAVGLVVLAPVLGVIAAVLYVSNDRPVLFGQKRAGFRGRPFTIWKFRTMQVDAEQRLSEHVRIDDLEQPMFKLRADPRVTRAGRILRRLSLDELPQLVNVLRGEMSLVGPRPEQVELVEQYRPEHRIRLHAKPGLTGPMQVYGRAELSFEERLAVERDYIENVSLGRDLRILALTVAPLARRSGAF